MHCLVCGTKLEPANMELTYLCKSCYALMPFAVSPEESFNHLISTIPTDELYLSSVYSLFSVHADFKYIELIYGLKYFGMTKIGKELGSRLGEMVKKQSEINYDCIVPIPIHHARLRERGFNQSFKIAEGVGSYLNIELTPKAIKRIRYTSTQTLLSKEQRKKNVSEAFQPGFDKKYYEGKNFLLIDDVLTTGSTMNACAKCLLENGAKRIDCATLAVA